MLRRKSSMLGWLLAILLLVTFPASALELRGFPSSPSFFTLTIVTSATGPLLIGGTGTTSPLTLRSTSGVGAAGADIIFQVGNNGATEAMRIRNSGNVGIDEASASTAKFAVGTNTTVGVEVVPGATEVLLRAFNRGAGSYGHFDVETSLAGTPTLRLNTNRNMLLATTTNAGTSGVGVFVLGPSTAPSTSPADVVQLRGADVAGAGTFGLEIRDEGGNLYAIGQGRIAVPRSDVAGEVAIAGFTNRTTGMRFPAGAERIVFDIAGLSQITIASDIMYLTSGFVIDFTGGSGPGLVADAANILAQRNSLSTQEFRVENTFTSATNREYGKLGWTSNVFRVGTVKGSGGGTARALALTTDDTERWTIGATSGHLVGGSGYAIQTTCVAVGSLPAGTAGMRTCVNDQLTTCPVLDGTFTAGGGVTCSAFYNGTAWVHS